uniref:Uncharacterized protein n=1 Tax=Oryza meridionalis TaxID=40149 RepID=A0A0E0C2Y2_9ORYZ
MSGQPTLRTLDIMLSDLNMLYGLPGDGKRKLPVHPLVELPCRRRRPLEEVALGRSSSQGVNHPTHALVVPAADACRAA